MFTFRLNPVKKVKSNNPTKKINTILYAQAIKRDDGSWFARVKTRGFEGYKDITILPFSEKSFELKGKINVFSHKKDKNGHYTRVIRTEEDSIRYPGNKEDYCPLCDKCIFQGYIIKTINGVYFDIINFVDVYSKAGHLVDNVEDNDNK